MAATTMKLVVIGDGKYKTALIIAATSKSFPKVYVPIVLDLKDYRLNTVVDGTNVDIDIWDTTGQEDYDSIRFLSYPDTDIFMICFSVLSRDSLASVQNKWFPEISKHAPGVTFILVGMKTHAGSGKTHDGDSDGNDNLQRLIPKEEAERVAQKINAENYIEVAAYTREGVDHLFDEAVRVFLRKNQKPVRRRFGWGSFSKIFQRKKTEVDVAEKKIEHNKEPKQQRRKGNSKKEKESKRVKDMEKVMSQGPLDVQQVIDPYVGEDEDIDGSIGYVDAELDIEYTKTREISGSNPERSAEADQEIVIFDELNISNLEELYGESQYNYRIYPFKNVVVSKMIGEGNFGCTFLARSGDLEFAIKMPKNADFKDDEQELKTLIKLPYSPNVLEIIGVCPDFAHPVLKGAQRLSVIVPYLINGDLKSYVSKFSPETGDYLNIVLGMARGISHFHDNQFIHRDIALRIFLVSGEGRIVTADFGMSQEVESSQGVEDIPGSYDAGDGGLIPWRWCAPETLTNKKSTKMADMWMFGVTILELFVTTPFRSSNVAAHAVETSRPDFQLELPDACPEILRAVAQRCCQSDPEKRPTVTWIIAEISGLNQTEIHNQNAMDEDLTFGELTFG